MTGRIPDDAIATDHRLEQAEQDATVMLAQHRWHWTLDKSNSDRVSMLAYAKAVGRNESTIRAYAKGYIAWDARQDHAEPIGMFVAEARTGKDTATATRAVAAAKGIAPTTVARAHQPETRRVRELARVIAAENRTTVAEEAPRIAEALAKAERAAATGTRGRRKAFNPQVYDITQHLLRARREILTAMEMAVMLPKLTPQVQQFLLTITANLREALDLTDARVSGTPGVDWDTEFAKITDFRIADNIPS